MIGLDMTCYPKDYIVFCPTSFQSWNAFLVSSIFFISPRFRFPQFLRAFARLWPPFFSLVVFPPTAWLHNRRPRSPFYYIFLLLFCCCLAVFSLSAKTNNVNVASEAGTKKERSSKKSKPIFVCGCIFSGPGFPAASFSFSLVCFSAKEYSRSGRNKSIMVYATCYTALTDQRIVVVYLLQYCLSALCLGKKWEKCAAR